MATTKNTKKLKEPLAIRVTKIIVLGLLCIILIAAIAQRIIHYYRPITK